MARRVAGFFAGLLLSLLVATPTLAGDANSVFVEDLTWPELKARVAAGTTTVLVPIGGTEQNGPHMVLGKHNVRVQALAALIAQQLGHTVVAPVLSYVPEGGIQPPVAHMRFPGTISISESAFEAVLDGAARSFKQHGFQNVVFLGDHGGYQKNQERVAERLNREWKADPRCRVFAAQDYYRASQTAFAHLLRQRGYSDAEIGQHAGLADTSLALAVSPALVRSGALAQPPSPLLGVVGDPRKSSSELGQMGIRAIVDASVASIQAFMHAPR